MYMPFVYVARVCFHVLLKYADIISSALLEEE